MSIYTVHEPLPRASEATADPVRFRFVRDGFHFWAFVLGPVWMLFHRLWLVFLLYVILSAALHTALWFAGATWGTKFVIGVLISMLIGLENSNAAALDVVAARLEDSRRGRSRRCRKRRAAVLRAGSRQAAPRQTGIAHRHRPPLRLRHRPTRPRRKHSPRCWDCSPSQGCRGDRRDCRLRVGVICTPRPRRSNVRRAS